VKTCIYCERTVSEPMEAIIVILRFYFTLAFGWEPQPSSGVTKM